MNRPELHNYLPSPCGHVLQIKVWGYISEANVKAMNIKCWADVPAHDRVSPPCQSALGCLRPSVSV